MTLRLVSETPEPHVATQLAEQARLFADAIESGGYGDVSRIGLVIEYDGGLHVEGWGSNTCPYDMMGLFEAAKLKTFADVADGL